MIKLLIGILALVNFSSFAGEIERYECDINSNEYIKVYFEINKSESWSQFYYLDKNGEMGPGAIATAGVDGEDSSLSLGYIVTTTPMGNNVKELLFIFEKFDNYTYLNLYNPFEQGASESGKCTKID